MGTKHSRTVTSRIGRLIKLLRYYPIVARSGLFDAKYYISRNEDVRHSGVDPLRHYLMQGGLEGRSPSELFLSDFYLSENRDVARSKVNPLLHYIRWGDREGRRPNPFFDPSWYRTHNHPQIPEGSTTLAHYVAKGRAKNLPTCAPCELREVLDTENTATPTSDILPSALAAWTAGRRYADWADRFDTLSPQKAAILNHRYPSWRLSTRFTVFLCARPQELDALLTSIRALQAQIYGEWRAFVIPLEPFENTTLHEELADTRCQITTWAEACTHLRTCTSETQGRVFCGLLQPGEHLREHAFLVAAHTIETHHDVDMIYSDEDILLGSGARRCPAFKPDWDPLLFSHVNYLGSSTLIDAKHCFKTSTPSFVDAHSVIDLFGINPTTLRREAVVHIPEILLHTTRASSFSSRAINSSATDLPSMRTLATALYNKNGSTCSVEYPLVSIVIPTKKNRALLEECLASILSKTRYPNYEIIIVDNDADQETKSFLATIAEDQRCRVLLQPGPFNYSALNNAAIESCAGDMVCLLNDDVVVGSDDWLETLVTFGKQPGVGAVGSCLLYPDGSIQHGGVVVGAHGLAAHAFVGSSPQQSYMRLAMYPREVSAVTAACLLVEKKKYLSVGGLDAEFLKVNFNDIDLCLKLSAAGLKNVVLPLPSMIHKESKSRGLSTATVESVQQVAEEAECMRSRWGQRVQRDPYYNPNLSLTSALYELSSNIESSLHTEDGTYGLGDEYSSLGRDNRLDIYRDDSNQYRAIEGSVTASRLESTSSPIRGLSVIILNKNAPELLVPLVAQLTRQQSAFADTGMGFEVIIGDTGSTNPETLALYDSLPSCAKVIRGMKYNFSRCNNALEKIATYDTLLFLNNDIIFPEDSSVLLSGFKRLSETPKTGILGGVLLYPNGTIQHMGCEFLTRDDLWGLPYHIHAGKLPSTVTIPDEAIYPSVTGAFFMIPRSLFNLCGGFDAMYAAECQDIALCLEAHRLGFTSTCVNLGPVIHIENATRPKGEESFTDRRRFLRKYGAYIQGAFQ